MISTPSDHTATTGTATRERQPAMPTVTGARPGCWLRFSPTERNSTPGSFRERYDPVILGALAALRQEQGRPGLLFADGHEDCWPPRVSPTGEAADCELGLALRLFDAGLTPRLRGVLPRIHAADVIAFGPRDSGELAAAGVATLDGRLGALIRPPDLTADRQAALAGLPALRWLHTDLDVLATTELVAVDYPQPGGLTWAQLTGITAAALATDGCAGWSVCIYNPDLDPGHNGADTIISYITEAITAADRRQC